MSQLRSDFAALQAQLKAMYQFVYACNGEDACGFPTILTLPLDQPAGSYFRNKSKLDDLHSALWGLVEHEAIRRALLPAAECIPCSDETSTRGVTAERARCMALEAISYDQLVQPQAGTLHNDEWFAQAALVVEWLDGVLKAGGEEWTCPKNPCAPACCTVDECGNILCANGALSMYLVNDILCEELDGDGNLIYKLSTRAPFPITAARGYCKWGVSAVETFPKSPLPLHGEYYSGGSLVEAEDYGYADFSVWFDPCWVDSCGVSQGVWRCSLSGTGYTSYGNYVFGGCRGAYGSTCATGDTIGPNGIYVGAHEGKFGGIASFRITIT